MVRLTLTVLTLALLLAAGCTQTHTVSSMNMSPSGGGGGSGSADARNEPSSGISPIGRVAARSLEQAAPGHMDRWAQLAGDKDPEDDADATRFVFDLVILDLDEGLARALLKIENDSDIEPRRNKGGIGDAAISLALNRRAGEVLYRQRFRTDEAEHGIAWSRTRWDVTRYDQVRGSPWLGDSDDNGMAFFYGAMLESRSRDLPRVAESEESVAFDLKLMPIAGNVSVQVDSVAETLNLGAWGPPDPEDADENLEPSQPSDPENARVQRRDRRLELRTTQRLAVETLATGETAVYQLARFQCGERYRLRLVIVRLLRG